MTTAERQERTLADPARMYRWGRIVAARVMRDELGQTNPADIEDAESVAHYAVAYALGRWDPARGEASTLIAMTVRQRVLQWWERDYKKRVPWISLTRLNVDGEERHDMPYEVPDFDRRFVSDYIRGCLRKLPTRERQLLIAYYLNGRSADYLAGEMGIQRKAFYLHLKRARERFGELMRGHEL